MTIAAMVLALVIGSLVGLMGGGGSIVAVPALTLVLGLETKDAIVTSLIVIGFSALAGTAGAWARGVLRFRIGATVGISAMAGAAAGAVAGARLPDHWQLTILAVIMFVAAALLWREPSRPVAAFAAAPSRLIVIGLGVGALTGLVGVGGGFLMVPALVAMAGLTMTEAGGASLLAMVLSTAAAVPAYAYAAPPNWEFIAPFAMIAAVAALAGGAVAVRMPQRLLQHAFASILVILGSYLLLKA
jgi:uncharacterized membrane protein YfcA